MAMLKWILTVVLISSVGCRSTDKTSYTVESVSRTALNPYDGQLVDKIDLSITIRKQW